MKVGDVIEFDAGDEYRLGVVTRELGQKYIVVTEDGDEMRPTEEEVGFELQERIDVDRDTDQIASRLSDMRDEIDATAEEVDVGFLWEFVSADGQVTAANLCELFFESTETDEVLGTLQALRDDELYFKERRKGFEPRTEDQVEELRRQIEARRREERRRQSFVETIVEILELEPAQRVDRAEEAMADEEVRQFAEILQEYAIYDQNYGEREEALELLDALEEELGRQLKGRYGTKAFWLMVEIGLWHEHENLWVHRYNLDRSADDEILEEVDRLRDRAWESQSWRRDLTDRECFSIDDARTRDIDDALSCRSRPEGGWEVGIHIADPSEFIDAGEPLDEHARKRGTSIYLPARTIPMFPEGVSEEVASLVAGSVRPSISVLAEFDEDFELVDHAIEPSAVEVDHRLTYERADEILASEEKTSLAESLGVLREIADAEIRRREQKGAVAIDLPDPDLVVDWNEQGEAEVRCGVKRGDSPSRGLVGECMVLANTLLGKFCRDHDIPVIYRAQETPDRDLVDDHVRSKPEGLPRIFAKLRRMKPGTLTTEPSHHFGLGVATYTQSTSPIRRYADLVCQRQIKAFLADDPLPHDEDAIIEILGTVESTSREAGRAQSESERYWLLEYLRRNQDETFEATIVEHKNDDGTHAAVWVHDVAQKFNCNFRKTVPLGEKAEVVVDHADPRKDQIGLKQA